MEQKNVEQIINFYQFQSKFYDLTRWLFLFDRDKILFQVKETNPNISSILDIGCGTGKSIKLMTKLFPNAEISGLDLSQSMLNIASKKLHNDHNVTFYKSFYPSDSIKAQKFDLILFSYSLSMFNPGYDLALENSYKQLAHNGILAIIDFHTTSSNLLKKWMNYNHVKLDGHLLPRAKTLFNRYNLKIKKSYFGLWSYFIFIGHKN